MVKSVGKVEEGPKSGRVAGSVCQPFCCRVEGISELHLMPMEMANVSQSNKLLEESEDFLFSLEEDSTATPPD